MLAKGKAPVLRGLFLFVQLNPLRVADLELRGGKNGFQVN